MTGQWEPSAAVVEGPLGPERGTTVPLGSGRDEARRGPVRRSHVAVVAGLCGAALLAVSAQRAGATQDDGGYSEEVLGRGAAVFQRTCAACHGMRAAGRPGSGDEAGPAIDEVEVAYVDLVLRTGRMPIAQKDLGIATEQLTDADREAVVAWMQDRFDLPGALPGDDLAAVGVDDAGRGLEPFVQHCAACHGAGGGGGVAGGGTFVPPISGSDPLVIAEATRVGPFDMPAFAEELVTDETLADIIAYLEVADSAPRSLLGLREVDEVATGIAVTVLLVMALGIVHLDSDRPDQRDRSDDADPGAGGGAAT